MPFVLVFLLALAAPAGAQDSASTRASACREWHECRQLALDALAHHEYERFHDLAWRTVQTGPPRDPALMYLLARAQSLSGRPDDALVMLGRLADMGVASDAATNDDFRAVRTLKEWPELEARLKALIASAAPMEASKADAAPAPAPPPAPAQRSTPAPSAAAEAPPTPAPAAPDVAPPPTPAPKSPEAPSAGNVPSEIRSDRPLVRPEDAVRVADAALSPHGLAYDAVSSRFVVADPAARKLVVLDERTQHAIDLVRASSAGFSDIAAFEIDPRRGDLWVLSTGDAAKPGSAPALATLHKLQLVSGRQITSFALPDRLAPARFADLAVTPGGVILMLDDDGGRILAFEPGSHEFKSAAALHLEGVTSLAPADEHRVYVAYADGIAQVELPSGTVTPLHGAASALAGFSRIRWSDGALVGIQRRGDGTYAAVRLKIGGSRATAVETIDASAAVADPTSVTLSGHDLFVLTRGGAGAGGEIVVERFRLK